MPRKKETQFEVILPLLSKVAVVIRTTPEIYDTLRIQMVGGVVTVGLPGTIDPPVEAQPSDPVNLAELAERRRQIEAHAYRRPVLTAADLAERDGFDSAAIERTLFGSGGDAPPAGLSNED